MASTIQELITQIRNGEILLPEFQRGYVWKSDQVRALVRALYKQRPTGHLPGPRLDRVWGVRGSSWKAEERQRAGRITTDVAQPGSDPGLSSLP